MKKFLTFFTFLYFFVTSVTAQIDITFGVGCTLPYGDFRLNNKTYDSMLIQQQGKVSNFSFSSGMAFQMGTRYMFNNSFGAELDANAVLGRTFHTVIEYVDTYGGVTKYNKQSGNYRSPISVTLHPSVYFKSSPVRDFSPYAKMGLCMMLYGKQYYDMTLTSNIMTNPWIYSETVTTNYFSVGFSGAIGVNRLINKVWSVGMEVNFQSLHPYAKRSTVTKHQRNGRDDLSSLTISGKEKEYYKKFDSPIQYDSEKPEQELSYMNNYSNVGVMFRVSYYIGKTCTTCGALSF